MKQLLLDSLKSSVESGLLILKFVVPLYVLADMLIYFDLLKYLGVVFAPFTTLLDLPAEAAVALASGVLINIYAGIAFAAPLGLSPYQWTVLAVFLFGLLGGVATDWRLYGGHPGADDAGLLVWQRDHPQSGDGGAP